MSHRLGSAGDILGIVRTPAQAQCLHRCLPPKTSLLMRTSIRIDCIRCHVVVQPISATRFQESTMHQNSTNALSNPNTTMKKSRCNSTTYPQNR